MTPSQATAIMPVVAAGSTATGNRGHPCHGGGEPCASGVGGLRCAAGAGVCFPEPTKTTCKIYAEAGTPCAEAPCQPGHHCITDPNGRNQNLAAMFNRIAMVYHYKGVCTMAFDGICPAATLECGIPGDPTGIDHACRLLEKLLTLECLAGEEPAREQLHLVESHLHVHIPRHVSYEFDADAGVDLNFAGDIEERNFTLMDPQQVFGYTRIDRPIQVLDTNQHDVTDEVLRVEQGRIYLNQTLMPAMITRDKLVIQQDCLCHLLQDFLPHHDTEI